MTKIYKHLTIVERAFIQLGLTTDLKPPQVALKFSSSTFTITRKLKRNCLIPKVKIRCKCGNRPLEPKASKVEFLKSERGFTNEEITFYRQSDHGRIEAL